MDVTVSAPPDARGDLLRDHHGVWLRYAWLSVHPGAASMGELLMISLSWVLATTLFLSPACWTAQPYTADAPV
jgi:hypothetical protein